MRVISHAVSEVSLPTYSINTTDSDGASALIWANTLASVIELVREFRAFNDYADNTGNQAVVSVTRSDGVREMFWSAAEGFFGRSRLAEVA